MPRIPSRNVTSMKKKSKNMASAMDSTCDVVAQDDAHARLQKAWAYPAVAHNDAPLPHHHEPMEDTPFAKVSVHLELIESSAYSSA